MIGGFKNKVTDIDFKYTTDPSRIVWVKTFYPHLGTLVNAIQSINYNSYEYAGTCIFRIKQTPKGSDQSTYTFIIENIIPNSKLGYYFFGGICYELLNDSSKNNPPLSNYVDPTGDIDVIVKVPEPRIKKLIKLFKTFENYDGYDILVLFGKNVNPYYTHIARWIYSKFVSVVEGLNLNIDGSVPFEINEYVNAIFADVKVGNAHVVMYLENENTIKIQLVFKIVSEGMTVIDHVVEFLISPPVYQDELQTIVVKDKQIHMQDMMSLFRDNFDAHQKRTQIVRVNDNTKYHKVINHTSRILYLLEYLNQNRIADPDLLESFNSYIIEPFTRKPSYTEFNQSLIYYRINKGVFEIAYIKLSDLLSAYCRVFNANGATNICDAYDEEKYNIIQQLVLHNVREKSIPMSLKMSIVSRRIASGIKKTKRRTKKGTKNDKKKTRTIK